MKLKKLLVMGLAGIMVASCLAGCGKGGSGKNGKNGDANTIVIKAVSQGMGEEWLEALVEGFEKKYPEYEIELLTSADVAAIRSAFGMEDRDDGDLYIDLKQYKTEYLEPLDDVLNSTADGDAKTIKEKFHEEYLKLEQSADGKYYHLSSCGGMVGIVYNQKMFEDAGITIVPRTTDELAIACDTLLSNDMIPFCHFKPAGYWEEYMTDVFAVQYDGLDYVMNNYYGCTDEQGKSPSVDVFTKKGGRYEALEVFAKLNTPETVLDGSNTYDHIIMQTKFLNGEAAMMVSGSWLQNEMSGTAGADGFVMMKTPVISSITDKLTTVKTDAQLRKVITAIDAVTDGEKEASTYQQGDSYVVDDITVSAADWDYIRAARNSMNVQWASSSAYIPNYADQIEGAKEFLRYWYSDEGYKIYTDTLHITLPLSLSQGEIDTTGWTAFELNQLELQNTTEQFVTQYMSGKHEIFTYGNATSWGASGKTYINRFCSKNESERLTAAEAWDEIVTNIKRNYENDWIKNIK